MARLAEAGTQVDQPRGDDRAAGIRPLGREVAGRRRRRDPAVGKGQRAQRVAAVHGVDQPGIGDQEPLGQGQALLPAMIDITAIRTAMPKVTAAG